MKSLRDRAEELKKQKTHTHTSLFSIARDSRPSRPPANHRGQQCGAGRLEGQCRWSQWLLAYLGGAAKLCRWSALIRLSPTWVSVNSSHKPPSICESVRFTHLPHSTGRRTLLHGAVSFRYMMTQQFHNCSFWWPVATQKLRIIWNRIHIRFMHKLLMSSAAVCLLFILRCTDIRLPVIAPLNRHSTLPNMEGYCKKNADFHP